MRGHFVVCGMGHVGYRVVELLVRLGESVVVLTEESREEWIRDAEASGVRVILGDARGDHALAQTGLSHARALIAATDQDITNIEIALDAQRRHPQLPVVIRLFDQTLATELERSFGLRRALAMSALAAPTFAAAALGEDLLASFPWEGRLIVAGKARVEPNGPLDGGDVAAVSARSRLMVLAIDREAETIRVLPSPEEPVHPGDSLILLGEKSWWDTAHPLRATGSSQENQDSLRRGLLARWRERWALVSITLRLVLTTLLTLILGSVFLFHQVMDLPWGDALYFVVTTVTTVGYGDISPIKHPLGVKLLTVLLMLMGSVTLAVVYSLVTEQVVARRLDRLFQRRRLPEKGHVVVVGLGNVGYRTASLLHQAGIPVVAVERNREGEFVTSAREAFPVVIGDARLKECLAEARVPGASAVVAVTQNDAVNLTVGLLARQMNPSLRTVARLFDSRFAEKVEEALPIDRALGASAVAAPSFVASALEKGARTGFLVHGWLLSVAEEKIPSSTEPVSSRIHRQTLGALGLLARDARSGLWEAVGDGRVLAGGEKVLAVRGRRLAPSRSPISLGEGPRSVNEEIPPDSLVVS